MSWDPTQWQPEKWSWWEALLYASAALLLGMVFGATLKALLLWMKLL